MQPLLAVLGLLVLAPTPPPADSRRGLPEGHELFQTVAALDAALFEAVNHCRLEELASYVADDLEFYHDLSGLSRTRQTFVDAVRSNLCGKVRRELVRASLEVHALPGFGALELGVHRFQHPGHEATEPVGEARFVHVWERIGARWQLRRVISFDHHSLPR